MGLVRSACQEVVLVLRLRGAVLAKKRSNLRDVAAEAGVSVATVSRVLNAPEKVAAPTRARVEAAITALRFIPSAAARAMNRGRSGTVAALLPTLDNSIYARVVNALETRLADRGLSLVVAQTKDDPELELKRAREMVDIGVEALIVAGVTHNPALYDLADMADMPVVAISYFEQHSRLPTIGYDNQEAAWLAARHLMGLGHNRIAVLHGPVAKNDRMRQRKAALDALQSAPNFLFLEVPLSVEGGYKALNNEAVVAAKPTAFLCFSDVIAHGALARAAALGLKVPKDVSIIGMEDLPSSQFTFPALTTIALSVEGMGEQTADALFQWLETDTVPLSIRLPVSLVQRETTGVAKPG